MIPENGHRFSDKIIRDELSRSYFGHEATDKRAVSASSLRARCERTREDLRDGCASSPCKWRAGQNKTANSYLIEISI
jgi:hypothetical protein